MQLPPKQRDLSKSTLLPDVKTHIKIAGGFTHYEKIIPILARYKSTINFSVYEGLNECAWNGGRINRPVFYDAVKHRAYESLGVGVSLTFSNPTIDLCDPVGLALLYTFHKTGNSVILQNLDLLDMIRKRFPLYQCIFSITGHPSSVPDPATHYKILENRFDIIVPKLEHNMLIEQYASDVSKYELLINDDCLYHCPLWKEHFDKIAEQNTKKIKFYDADDHARNIEIEECWLPKFNPDLGDRRAKEKQGFLFGMSLNAAQLSDRLSTGINRFKISGREMASDDFRKNFEYYINTIAKVKNDNTDS